MMTTSPDWLMLPDLVLSDLMLMVGLQSLESLRRCSQVCRTWNDVIRRNIWENSNRKNILRAGIEKKWGPDMLPSDEDFSQATWLGKDICDNCDVQLFLMKVFY